MTEDRNRSVNSGSVIGVVAIGRNEGERLRKCLESVARSTGAIVYVDSGSTDASPALARDLGVPVVALDLDTPFTAGRARNEGFHRLRQQVPALSYVQFIDGDCEVAPGWVNTAARFLDGHPGIAVVCGRRRERYPETSVYNLLCDIEWDTPTGETQACGGDAMVRADAFESVNGFSSEVIAGEEPELCVRLREVGWRIWRLGEEMTLHDAAMKNFDQWWRRTLRSGYAFAQGAHLHGARPERHWVRESRSAWFWGAGIPLATLAVATFWSAWGWSLLAAYPLQVIRLALREGRSTRENWCQATFLVLGKFPEMIGQMKFLAHRHAGSQSRLIEYK